MNRTEEGRMIAQAFLKGEPLRKARTYTDGMTVWLHKNRIAWRDENDIVWVTLAGWPTTTTRDRVNAILDAMGAGFCITQWKGDQLIGYSDPHLTRFSVHSREHLPVTDLVGMMAYKAA